MDASTDARQAVEIVEIQVDGHSYDDTDVPVSVPHSWASCPGMRIGVEKGKKTIQRSKVLVLAYG